MSKEDPRRLICRCIGVSSTRIRELALRHNYHNVTEISEATKAGTGCGICHPESEEVLADLYGEPFDGRERLENQAVCALETQSRVEGSLASHIEPKLEAKGLKIVEVEAKGLDVTVILNHPAEPETATHIKDKLKKLVCPDLEVKILP